MSRPNLVLGSLRELSTVSLVAGLCGAYAGVLMTTSTVLAATGRESGGTVGVLLSIVSGVFVLIALYVGVIVIVNAVDTVIAGRLRQIALLRLLGSRGRDLRREVTRGTAVVGSVGAALGLAIGVVLSHGIRLVLVSQGTLPDTVYPIATTNLVWAFVAIASAAALAGWLGARPVLGVSPAAAMSGAAVPAPPRRRVSVMRAILAAIGVFGGAFFLAGAGWLGETQPQIGFPMAFLGALVSGTGLLIGARFVIPAAVAMLCRLLGRDPASVVARRNALLDPLRTTRSTMGLVIGVALVTTIASGMDALGQSVASWQLGPEQRVQAEEVLAMTSTILICIVVISSIIAAVGFVSTMSLTVIQRHREIGLLRSLGFTQRQVRTMITKESVALSAAAVVLGLVIGLLFGTVGAQSLIGGLTTGLVWGAPPITLAAIAAAGLVLVLVTSQGPARRAVRVAPVEALRIDS